MLWARLRAAGVSLLALWVLYAHVSWDFSPVRVRLVTTPAAPAETVSVPLPDATGIEERLLVVVCRLQNTGHVPVEVAARAGSRLLGSYVIPPGASVRWDLAWERPRPIPADYRLDLTADSLTWRLEAAELANLHGFSRGLLNLVVLPAGQSIASPPSWLVALCAGLALLLGFCRPARMVGRTRWIVLSLAGLALMLFILVAVAEAVSAFRLVLSPRTFFLGTLALAAPRLPAIAGRTRNAAQRHPTVARLAALGACGALGAGFYASAMLQTLATYDGNYSGFLHLTRAVAAQCPFLQERPDLTRSLVLYDVGYDGQFKYLMAFDPLLGRFPDSPERYREVVDAPPYRYGRIGFSLLTAVVSGGRPERFPATMMWLVMASHFVLALALATLAARQGRPPFVALLYLTIPGFLPSMLFALPEALGAALIVSGLTAWLARRLVVAMLCLALALLVRETWLVLVAVLVLATVRLHGRAAAALLSSSVLPWLAWRGYVAWRLFPDFGWEGLFFSPGDFTFPLAGLLDLVRAGMAGTQASPEIAAALWYPLLLLAAAGTSGWLLHVRRGPIELAAGLYGVLALSLNYEKIWAHVPSGERGTIELFLCLLVLLLSADTRRDQRLLQAVFVLAGAYTLLVAPEAPVARAALLLIR